MALSKSKIPSLSVFLPCYNEAANLKNIVADCLKFLPEITSKFEILIINDGSQDNTLALAHQLAKKNNRLQVVNHPRNLGYGMALRSGFAATKMEWTFFMDADRQFDIKELKAFIPHTINSNVIIGYRKNRAEGAMRALNANLFKIFIDLLFRVHVKDIDCAFKLIRTDRLKKIHFKSSGAMISAELLYRLKKMQEPFIQVPVTHYKRQFGNPTGNNLKVVFKAGMEAIKLYFSMKFSRS